MSTSIAASRVALTGAVFMALAPAAVHAQTPSPLAEWQYSSGILLEQMFEPKLPTWRIRVGPSASFQPRYDGSDRYHLMGGPSIDIRYRDRFFLSTGEGIGVNVLTGPNWRVGVAASYDLGRRAADDLDHLSGMGNINPAPSLRPVNEVTNLTWGPPAGRSADEIGRQIQKDLQVHPPMHCQSCHR